LSLSLYAAILEIAQIWVPGRDPKFIDFAASSAGAFIGSALAWIGLRAINFHRVASEKTAGS
jgi:VanZ family protein